MPFHVNFNNNKVVMTFSACSTPLNQVLKLWDFYLAYGVHLNILVVTARLVQMRNEIMQSNSPMKCIRKMPELDAASLIKDCMNLVKICPEDIYDMLARHPYDVSVYETPSLFEIN